MNILKSLAIAATLIALNLATPANAGSADDLLLAAVTVTAYRVQCGGDFTKLEKDMIDLASKMFNEGEIKRKMFDVKDRIESMGGNAKFCQSFKPIIEKNNQL